jgi:hypothetical protein
MCCRSICGKALLFREASLSQSGSAARGGVRDNDSFREEINDLESLRTSLENSEDDLMARKQMAYRRERLRKGR